MIFSDRIVTPVRVRDAIYNNYGEGRVEFLRNRQWISAYFDTWETPEARLFCKLLGYKYVQIRPLNKYLMVAERLLKSAQKERQILTCMSFNKKYILGTCMS